MTVRIPLILAAATALTLAATPAAAEELRWGAFKDNGCINPMTHPGLRSQSAVLWGIPPGQSWEQTCARTPATFDGVKYDHPAVCVNTAAADPLASGAAVVFGGIVCGGAALVGELVTKGGLGGGLLEACGNVIVHGAEGMIDAIAGGYYAKPAEAIAGKGRVRPWPMRLFGAVTKAEASGWKSKLARAVLKNGVGQVKQNGGGLNIWGVFAVADARCLPPQYLALPGAPWPRAAQACAEQGLKLCTKADICAGGQPVVGKPDGDVWAAVGDAENAWVSVGTSYPERLCRLHRESLGHAPGWGTMSGPQPVTGKPTALRCCP